MTRRLMWLCGWLLALASPALAQSPIVTLGVPTGRSEPAPAPMQDCLTRPIVARGVSDDLPRRNISVSRQESTAGSWWDSCTENVGGFLANCRWQSDNCFPCFTSPITSPSLFEDPRSLTEIRPIFTYQSIPSSNPVFRGGSAETFGLQARLAFTEKWSFVMNKFGGAAIQPGDGSIYGDASGWSEIHLGPKWTFWRNPDLGAIAAAGLTFQIPAGPAKVFQDTGDFSMVPYLTGAWNFGRSSYGSFNIMDTAAYSFQIGSGRSDYFYNGLHLDYDVANLHKFYPLLELNWYHYTSSGNDRPAFNQEGRDWGNFGGSDVGGRDYLSLAAGMRYKFTERAQCGIAAEFPVSSPQDFQNFRLTLDFIFRY